MSAAIRIKIMGGTSIEDAYDDCVDISFKLGGVSIETNFNGVEMFYHHQSRFDWCDDYKRRVYGMAKEGGAKCDN